MHSVGHIGVFWSMRAEGLRGGLQNICRIVPVMYTNTHTHTHSLSFYILRVRNCFLVDSVPSVS